MTKKIRKVLVWVLLLALLTPLAASAAPVTFASQYKDAYIKTDNGKSIYVRDQPNKRAHPLGKAKYGEKVQVDTSFTGNANWSCILWKGKEGFVQTRYLVSEDPGPYKKATKAPGTPKPTKDPKKEAEDLKKEQELLNKELKSLQEVQPFYIAVRPQRATGWVNFRVGPSTITSSITSFPSGKELIALGETNKWYRARDPETDQVGYIYKSLTTPLDKKLETDEEEGTEKLGKLSVNGDFDLTCKLPEGYTLQVVDIRGESIIASITSEDPAKPQMYLSIAYDELYGEVERMNDLSADDLAILEESFTSEYQVEIEYRETGYGTKLLIAREVGNDTDFVDILSIYKGYFVEFNMTPNPSVPDQALTEEQIQMCIDFLTDVDFNPVTE